MTNSLREEIKKEIDDIIELVETNNDNSTETTNNILKLIEKRIDSIPLSENYPEGYYQAVSLHQIERDIIAKIKREMVK